MRSDEILSRATTANARGVASRRYKSPCEIRLPGSASPGMGEDETPDINAGRSRCTVTQATRTTENGTVDGAPSLTEYEIALPLGTHIEPSARIAVPAFYPRWESNKQYALKSIVTPTNWTSGATPTFEVVRPGITGPTEPKWPTKRSATVQSGTAVLRYLGRAFLYEVMGSNENETQLIETVVRAKEIN